MWSYICNFRYGNGYYLTLVIDDGSTDVTKSIEHVDEETKNEITEDSDIVASRNTMDEIDALLNSNSQNKEIHTIEPNKKEQVKALYS